MSAEANRRITALAAQRAVHAAFQWLHLHEPQLRRWQLEAIAIPAPPFQESARAAWFLERFRELGLSNVHLDAEGNALGELTSAPSPQNSVILSAERSSESKDPPPGRQHDNSSELSNLRPVLLISAHLDTVFPAGTNCKPLEEGSIIHAPGACDNAAGLTALLAIAAALKHANIMPETTILFAANVGEEGEGDLRGMRHLFDPARSPYAARIQTAIALEGSGNATVIDRALGSRRLRVTVSGPGGHSWADAGRPNPIVALAEALLYIERLKLPATPRTTLNVGTISGGTTVNSIPAEATADLDLRSASSMELDRLELSVLQTLTNTVASRNARSGEALELQVARIGDRPAASLAPSSALAQSLRAIDRHLGLQTDSRIGSTDANLPLSLGVPALAIGCGGVGGGIHTLREWYDPTGRDLALRRVLLLVLDACPPPRL